MLITIFDCSKMSVIEEICMLSIAVKTNPVTFPEFTGERIYMRGFKKQNGLPKDLRRWQDTVDQMLEGVDCTDNIYLMVDQAIVKASTFHRRPGLHIDGYWVEDISCHGGGGHRNIGGHGGHRRSPGSHRGDTGGGSHIPKAGWNTGGSWKNADFQQKEGLILASNIAACRAVVGHFEGEILEGGDASLIDVSGLQSIMFEPNTAYAGNVTMLHESLPILADCQRTLVRLNVQGWHPND